jgi:hypothetical protein
MSTQSVYEYSDGNANLYSLKGTTLNYSPTKPEESSTGIYSGGEPKTVTLSELQADSIRTLIEAVSGNTSIQITDRVKGSGMIRLSDRKNKKQFILQPGSEENKSIESTFKKYLK